MVGFGNVEATCFVTEGKADSVVGAFPSYRVGEFAVATLPQIFAAPWAADSRRLWGKDEPTLRTPPQHHRLLLSRW